MPLLKLAAFASFFFGYWLVVAGALRYWRPGWPAQILHGSYVIWDLYGPQPRPVPVYGPDKEAIGEFLLTWLAILLTSALIAWVLVYNLDIVTRASQWIFVRYCLKGTES